MPTYQYACTECGERLEVVQKFTDDPLTECPACHGRLRKLFSSVGVVFKGSGFYKTDSRAAASKAKSSSDPAAAKGAKDSAASADGGSASTSSTASGGDSTSGASSGGDTSSGGDSKVA